MCLLFGQAAQLLRDVIRGQRLVAREARAVLLELSAQLPVELLLLMVGRSGGRSVGGCLRKAHVGVSETNNVRCVAYRCLSKVAVGRVRYRVIAKPSTGRCRRANRGRAGSSRRPPDGACADKVRIRRTGHARVSSRVLLVGDARRAVLLPQRLPFVLWVRCARWRLHVGDRSGGRVGWLVGKSAEPTKTKSNWRTNEVRTR